MQDGGSIERWFYSMTTEIQDIENKIDVLAKAVIPKQSIDSFLQLPLKEKVLGIMFFAVLAEDQKIIGMCKYAEKVMK